MGRPRKYIINLSENDAKRLKQLIGKKHFQIDRCCQILLELDVNRSNPLILAQIAKTFGVCQAAITNIIKDYTNNALSKAITYKRNPNSNAAFVVAMEAFLDVYELPFNL